MGLNQVTLIGNLGADPEMAYTANGKAVTNFRIAVNERYGETEKTQWFAVQCWERLAEVAQEYLTKGREVFVQGSIYERKYQDRDGNERTVWEVNAQTIRFIGSAPGGDGGGREREERAPAYRGGSGNGSNGGGGGRRGRSPAPPARSGRAAASRGAAPAAPAWPRMRDDIEPDDLPF